MADDRKPNTLHIEINMDIAGRLPFGAAGPVRRISDLMLSEDFGNAIVLDDGDGNDVGMACMVYREPGSHRGGK